MLKILVQQICKQLDLRIGTILVGDPLNPPTIKACPGFSGSTVINGRDFKASDPTTVFFIAVKNIIIDTTAVDASTVITALDWTTSQACHLTNVKINMPPNSSGHTGVLITAGSSTTITDVEIVGGNVGINHSNQQAAYKNIKFSECGTAFKFSGGDSVLVRSTSFDLCGICIDASSKGSIGALTVLDAVRTNSGPVVKFYDSSNDPGDRNNQGKPRKSYFQVIILAHI
jgi:glucan 1,3-beta-glucosidase